MNEKYQLKVIKSRPNRDLSLFDDEFLSISLIILKIMIKAVVALLLLALSQQFTTFQLILWSENPAREASNGSCMFTHPLPRTMLNPYDHLLALSGIKFEVIDHITFDAQVLTANSTQLLIRADLYTTLLVFEIRFFVVLVEQSNPWAQIENQFAQNITARPTTITFNLSRPLVNPPFSIGNYEAYPVFQGAIIHSTVLRVGFHLDISALNQTSLSLEVLTKTYDNDLFLLRFSVLILDTTAISNLNLEYVMLENIRLFNNVNSFSPNDPVQIDQAQVAPFAQNGGFQGSCFCGFYYFGLDSHQTVQFIFDFTTDPIAITINGINHNGVMILIDISARVVCAQTLYSGAECQAFGFARCIYCTQSTCLQCNSQTVLDGNNSCVCSPGQLLGDYCNIIQGCVNLTLVLGAKSCQECDGVQYHSSPVNGICRAFSAAECQAFGFARCSTCNVYECLTCNSETFLDGNSTCACLVGEPLGEYCNTIPGCVNLTLVQGVKSCQQCDGIDFHPSPVNRTCRRFQGAECSAFGFAGCVSCTQSMCLQCNSQSFLENNSTCSCYEGEPLGEYCNTTPGCINLTLVLGLKMCQECDGIDFIAEPVGGSCRCINNGTIRNGICNSLTGCISPEIASTGEIRCLYCDGSSNFNTTPSSEGLCECVKYYQVEGPICIEVCGDGVLFSSNSSLCDDGNVVDQDGCSSSCTVQDQYRCSSTGPLLPSSCVYQGIQIDLTLSYAERNGEENSGTFAFTFYPRLFFFSQMNFTQKVNFSCASEYSVTEMSYSEGELVVQVDFTKDLENAECSLSISYDQQLATVKNSSLNFTAVSRNEELTLVSEEDISKRKTIKFIFTYLSLGFLGVFLLSLCHKMIGAELAVSSQMVYLSFTLYARPSYLLVALRSFSLVTGYRTLFFRQEYDNMLLSFSYRAEMSPQVLENHIVWCGVLLALLLLTGTLKVYDYFTSAKGREEPHCGNSGRMRLLYDHLLFPLSVFSFLFTVLSSFVNSLRSLQVQGTFPKTINCLSWLLLLLPLGLVFSQIFKAESQPQGSDKRSRQFKKGYVPLFLVRLLLLAVLLSLGITQTFSFLIYPIALLVLLYLFLIVVYRPYKSCFSNLSIIFNQSLTLLAVTLALINKFFTIDSNIEAFILFILQGLIILCLAFSLIRVFLHICDLCKKEGEQSEGTQPEPKKAIKLTDVDISLDRACAEQKRRINPYRAILPQHSSPKHRRGRFSEGGYEFQQEYQLDPHLREIKDRLMTSLKKSRGVE